ncbi:MarR family winged helix-turn-helix transcriptional regulator [Amycolatopsis sp. NPDC004625]|uniref:MarR family winged helix-turn-helix transcriptional regulator n=1 Tax=Amycolatopsis sp. NPDC004625 TaxID=3154670 RepID=UPI0033B563C7
MSSLPVVNQPPHRCGALIDYVARRLRLRTETVLAPLGIRPRHLIALTVLRDRGGISQQDLAKILEMDGTNVVGLLNDLEAENLVERRRSATDRRRHVVELTDVGAKLLARAEFALAAVEDEVFSDLGDDQRETLYELLQQATKSATEGCREPGPC